MFAVLKVSKQNATDWQPPSTLKGGTEGRGLPRVPRRRARGMGFRAHRDEVPAPPAGLGQGCNGLGEDAWA